MSLEQKLKAYLSSPAGKKKVAEEKAKAIEAGCSFGQPGGAVVSKEEALKAAREMRTILHSELVGVGFGTITLEDIIVEEPVVDRNGDLTVNIRFDEQAIFRPSVGSGSFSGRRPEYRRPLYTRLECAWCGNRLLGERRQGSYE